MLYIVAYKIYIKFQFAMIIKYITHLIKCQEISKKICGIQKTACKGRKEIFMERNINTRLKKEGLLC